METVEHELDGVWVDDWLGFIRNLKPAKQSFFSSRHMAPLLCFILPGQMRYWIIGSNCPGISGTVPNS